MFLASLEQFQKYICISLCLWQVLSCVKPAQGKQRTQGRYHLRRSFEIKDKIIEHQCLAKCKDSRGSCVEQCLIDMIKHKRRGECPNINAIFQNITPYDKISCLDNCHQDYDCPEVQKCCNSSCGPVCMQPIGVLKDAQLPPIPEILTNRKHQGHKKIITIKTPETNSTYYCQVESRYHIGINYSPRKLGKWQWQHVEQIGDEITENEGKKTLVEINLKPGRWYQLRVAAINENGFRGYSKPSEPFNLKNELPKAPKPPSTIQVVSARYDGKYYTLKIVWCPSKSNLPIEKYKIMWSQYIENNSLTLNESFVKDRHQFEIGKLQPNSNYYIQVQAMSIIGKRRLKSETCQLLYNTTASMIASPYMPLKCNNEQRAPTPISLMKTSIATNNGSATTTVGHMVSGYEVRFRLNRKLGMIVQISGFHPHKEKVYELCPKDTNCEQREYSAIRVKKDSLEFSKLKYNTTYMLKAVQINASRPSEGSFTFTTPKCENFRKRFPKMQIKC